MNFAPRWLVTGALAAVVALPSAQLAFAQTVRTDLYVTNGPVYAMAEVAGKLYIGGDFYAVGPATGAAVPLDVTTGQVLGLPKVIGIVYAIASDGIGGWYVGGIFSKVGGEVRNNIAHIEGDYSVSAWNPNANGPVYTLAVSGGTVYAGGDFTSMGGQMRYRVAALNASTGEPTQWDPLVNAT